MQMVWVCNEWKGVCFEGMQRRCAQKSAMVEQARGLLGLTCAGACAAGSTSINVDFIEWTLDELDQNE